MSSQILQRQKFIPFSFISQNIIHIKFYVLLISLNLLNMNHTTFVDFNRKIKSTLFYASILILYKDM